MPEDRDHKKKPGRFKRPRTPKPPIFDWAKFDPAKVKVHGHPSMAEELTTYRDHLPELLNREGAYVVIKGKDYAVLDDRDAAIKYAIQHYGAEPVTVLKIVAKQPMESLGGATLP